MLSWRSCDQKMMDDERGLPDDRGGLLVANGIVNGLFAVSYGLKSGYYSFAVLVSLRTHSVNSVSSVVEKSLAAGYS